MSRAINLEAAAKLIDRELECRDTRRWDSGEARDSLE